MLHPPMAKKVQMGRGVTSSPPRCHGREAARLPKDSMASAGAVKTKRGRRSGRRLYGQERKRERGRGRTRHGRRATEMRRRLRRSLWRQGLLLPHKEKREKEQRCRCATVGRGDGRAVRRAVGGKTEKGGAGRNAVPVRAGEGGVRRAQRADGKRAEGLAHTHGQTDDTQAVKYTGKTQRHTARKKRSSQQ